MKKVVSFIICVFIMTTAVSSAVFADTDIDKVDITKVINLDDSRILEITELNETDTLFCITTETVDQQSKSMISTRSSGTVNKTVAKYFYITSSGERVAEYTLAASFTYNGVDVFCSGYQDYATALVPGWSITSSSANMQPSNSLAGARGQFTLYENGNYNNSDYIQIYCDQNGNVWYYD